MKIRFLILGLIIVLALILRFYGLDRNPPGLYSDELSIGYNAYSILKTGHDEHGVFLPLHFKAFGEYKLPVYIYLTSISIALLGENAFAVRFPSAAFGTMTVVAIFFLVKKLFEKNKQVNNTHLALVVSLLLAISSWHLQFSRGGFEAIVALFFVVSGLFLWLQKKIFWRLSGTFLFITAMYTYNAARIFVPFFLAVLFIIFWKQKKASVKELTIHSIFSVLLSIPFLPILISGAAFIRSAQTSAFTESLSRFPTDFPILSHLFTFFANYSSYFSPSFLFFFGDGIGRHGTREIGQLYLFELPFLLIGFLILIRGKYSFEKKILTAWLFLAVLPASLNRPSPHALRSLFMVIPFLTIVSLGILVVVQNIAKMKNVIFKCILVTLMIFGLFYNAAIYLRIYWLVYPEVTAIDWQNGFEELFSYVKEIENDYEYITVTNWYGASYIAALFYLPYNPTTYLVEEGSSLGFGKYTFSEHLPEEADGKKSLLIYPANIDVDYKKIRSIYFLNGDVAFDVYEI